jgi:hypothetical protein
LYQTVRFDFYQLSITMKKLFPTLRGSRIFFCVLLTLFLFSYTGLSAAKTGTPLRRPISPQQPMWLIHIDTWNLADPQKIIDMIPEDIKPYVVFNISLSINHRGNKWLQVEYGYETAKSWLRTCAENRVWAMIQPSSGAFCHFSDTDLSVYDEFFRDYPNFLGFNYAEQFWGFGDPYGVTYKQRLNHWTRLMGLNKKYGGYLIVSFTNGYWDANRNGTGMFKQDPAFAAVCKENPENFILCEKFTMASGFHDNESTSLGAWLSGFSGQYGIRFDECGWSGSTPAERKFPVSAGAAPCAEHMMLTGQTVFDGPETIPQQASREAAPATTDDGYTKRQWEFYPQFYNISMDMYRKILDGTIRILTRKEVIERTKLVMINDVATGDDRALYSTPESLFNGIYLMDDDGTYMRNRSWFKKTGRFPAIPIVFQLADPLANSFQIKVNKTDYEKRWPTTEAKVAEFNKLFPEEYTGDLYAGRSENGWVTYNPFKIDKRASGNISFKYNTCEKFALSYAKYSVGIVKEFSDKVTFYLTNYDNKDTTLKVDTIRIYGSTTKPTLTWKDRASHQPSRISFNWNGGIFTIVVAHNGPLDMTVNCAGKAQGRLTRFTVAPVVKPAIPPVYDGPFQYEAENFEYKNIEPRGNVTNGINKGVSNYTAQGFMRFGIYPNASARDIVTALKAGSHTLKVKYSAPDGPRTIQLVLNGVRSDLTFAKTDSASGWKVLQQRVDLKKGANSIVFNAKGASSYALLFDNIIIDK